jgi:hypothetical protein
MPVLVLTCSRNAHDRNVLVRCAQVVTKPGQRVNMIQRRTSEKSLGLRSQSWQDAARQLASYYGTR